MTRRPCRGRGASLGTSTGFVPNPPGDWLFTVPSVRLGSAVWTQVGPCDSPDEQSGLPARSRLRAPGTVTAHTEGQLTGFAFEQHGPRWRKSEHTPHTLSTVRALRRGDEEPRLITRDSLKSQPLSSANVPQDACAMDWIIRALFQVGGAPSWSGSLGWSCVSAEPARGASDGNAGRSGAFCSRSAKQARPSAQGFWGFSRGRLWRLSLHALVRAQPAPGCCPRRGAAIAGLGTPASCLSSPVPAAPCSTARTWSSNRLAPPPTCRSLPRTPPLPRQLPEALTESRGLQARTKKRWKSEQPLPLPSGPLFRPPPSLWDLCNSFINIGRLSGS